MSVPGSVGRRGCLTGRWRASNAAPSAMQLASCARAAARSHQPAGRHALGTHAADNPRSGSAHDSLGAKGEATRICISRHRTRVTSMATMYSATRPLMLIAAVWRRPSLQEALAERSRQTQQAVATGLQRACGTQDCARSRGEARLLDGSTVRQQCSARLFVASVMCPGRGTKPPTSRAPRSRHTYSRQAMKRQRTRPSGTEREATLICISRESNPGHIDGNDVFCH